MDFSLIFDYYKWFVTYFYIIMFKTGEDKCALFNILNYFRDQLFSKFLFFQQILLHHCHQNHHHRHHYNDQCHLFIIIIIIIFIIIIFCQFLPLNFTTPLLFTELIKAKGTFLIAVLWFCIFPTASCSISANSTSKHYGTRSTWTLWASGNPTWRHRCYVDQFGRYTKIYYLRQPYLNIKILYPACLQNFLNVWMNQVQVLNITIYLYFEWKLLSYR